MQSRSNCLHKKRVLKGITLSNKSFKKPQAANTLNPSSHITVKGSEAVFFFSHNVLWNMKMPLEKNNKKRGSTWAKC